MPKTRTRIPRRKRIFGTKSAMQPVVKTLKKQVQHLMRVDRNQVYTMDDPNTAIPTTAGLVTYLNPQVSPLAYGAANDANTKAIVLAKSLKLSLDLTFQVNSNCRIIVFRDTANKGVLPTVGDIIKDSGGGFGSTILSSYNIDTTQRFKILYDRTHHFLTSIDTQAVTQAGPGRANKIIKIFKTFKDLKMEYSAGAGTVADAEKNQLFMLQISSNANATAGTYVSRLICEPPKASQ